MGPKSFTATRVMVKLSSKSKLGNRTDPDLRKTFYVEFYRVHEERH